MTLSQEHDTFWPAYYVQHAYRIHSACIQDTIVQIMACVKTASRVTCFCTLHDSSRNVSPRQLCGPRLIGKGIASPWNLGIWVISWQSTDPLGAVKLVGLFQQGAVVILQHSGPSSTQHTYLWPCTQ